MVQYHALLLLYEIRRNDMVGLTKIVNQLIRSEPHSPLAMCVLIRYAKNVILGDSQTSVKQDLVNFLDRCLHHRVEVLYYIYFRWLCLKQLELYVIFQMKLILILQDQFKHYKCFYLI